MRAIRASQHILLYGITIDGATLCPGNSNANTTSFALQGLLGPRIAVLGSGCSPLARPSMQARGASLGVCVCVCVCV